jgi:hypothetical protein
MIKSYRLNNWFASEKYYVNYLYKTFTNKELLNDNDLKNDRQTIKSEEIEGKKYIFIKNLMDNDKITKEEANKKLEELFKEMKDKALSEKRTPPTESDIIDELYSNLGYSYKKQEEKNYSEMNDKDEMTGGSKKYKKTKFKKNRLRKSKSRKSKSRKSRSRKYYKK